MCGGYVQWHRTFQWGFLHLLGWCCLFSICVCVCEKLLLSFIHLLRAGGMGVCETMSLPCLLAPASAYSTAAHVTWVAVPGSQPGLHMRLLTYHQHHSLWLLAGPGPTISVGVQRRFQVCRLPYAYSGGGRKGGGDRVPVPVWVCAKPERTGIHCFLYPPPPPPCPMVNLGYGVYGVHSASL